MPVPGVVVRESHRGDTLGTGRATDRGVTRETKTLLALLAYLVLVLAWLGGTVATVAAVDHPGGAVVMGMLVFGLGYGFVQEGREALANVC